MYVHFLRFATGYNVKLNVKLMTIVLKSVSIHDTVLMYQ